MSAEPVRCDAYAELTGDGFFHPISCEKERGHAGPHRVTLYVGGAGQEIEWPVRVGDE